jgi:hypothetical protein
MDKKSIVIVLSHHYNRREKLYDNLFKNLENIDNVEYGIAVPEDTPLNELDTRFGTVIKYDRYATVSTAKNVIIKKYLPTGAFLHIVEDDMIVKFNEYLNSTETLMEFLKLPIFAATTPDSQNKIFGILTPRFVMTDITLLNDRNLPSTIEYYSNESKSYICINLMYFKPRFYFDESMNYFYLSHNFWKRHHTDKSVPFLNFYPAIKGEEKLIYRDISIPSHITEAHIKDATNEVQTASLKWEPETAIDGPINQIMYAIEHFRK